MSRHLMPLTGNQGKLLNPKNEDGWISAWSSRMRQNWVPSVLGQRRPLIRDIRISWVWQVVATGWQPDTVCFWFFPIIQSEHDFMRMRRKMGTIKHPNHIYSTNLYRCFSGVSTPAARESPGRFLEVQLPRLAAPNVKVLDLLLTQNRQTSFTSQ